MEASERQVVLILADISGYTRFMVENQLAAVHGQAVITFLIETMLKEVDIPLTLHGIEGDAVFLSASHPGTDEEWKAVLAATSAAQCPATSCLARRTARGSARSGRGCD